MYSLTDLTLYLVIAFLLTVIVAVIVLSRKFYEVLQSYKDNINYNNYEDESAFISFEGDDSSYLINLNEVRSIHSFDTTFLGEKEYKIIITYINGNIETIEFEYEEDRDEVFDDLTIKLTK